MADSQTPTPQMIGGGNPHTLDMAIQQTTATPQMIFLPSEETLHSETVTQRGGFTYERRAFGQNDEHDQPMLQLWHALSGGQKPAQKPAAVSARSEVPLSRMGDELAGLRITNADVQSDDGIPYVVLTLECGVTLYANEPTMYEPTPQV